MQGKFCIMKVFFRKLFYYRDVGLLFFIIANILIVALTPPEKRLRLVDVDGIVEKGCSFEKLRRYVTFVCFIMRRLRINPSCFTNSIAICRVVKKKGFDAKIVFGCNFEERKLRGHCWVDFGEKMECDKFQQVFTYPA